MLSPIADGPLESDSWRNALIFIENTIHYLRFQACLMNKAGLMHFRSLLASMTLAKCSQPMKLASQKVISTIC